MFDTIQFPADWVIRFDLYSEYPHFWVIKNNKKISVAYLENGWEFSHDDMDDCCCVRSADELILCLEREFDILNNKEGAPHTGKDLVEVTADCKLILLSPDEDRWNISHHLEIFEEQHIPTLTELRDQGYRLFLER